MALMPKGAKASRTALTIVGGAAIVPASPTPFTPSGLTGEGVSTVPTSRNTLIVSLFER